MDLNDETLPSVIERLVLLPKECEWAEFKSNWKKEVEIGEYLSALANGACLHGEKYGYLVFGIKDVTHSVEGTTFKPKSHKIKQEELENWLAQRISPRVDFEIHEFIYQEKHLALFRIMAANGRPVAFQYVEWIRVGGITRKLQDFPEKERKIWTNVGKIPFEKEIARENVSPDDIINLLDTQSLFHLLKITYPSTREKVIEKLIREKLVSKTGFGLHITNLGAILFAKDLKNFEGLKRKAVRVNQYAGNDKTKTLKDQEGVKGYAVGFKGLIDFINNLLPSNEEIGPVFRETIRMYPEIAIRELVANAVIHQDFSISGTGPMIDIFSDRIEISNPGIPLITPDRFIDEYQSRNEEIAGLMRRFKICEEKGSGIDKVIFQIELYQLPALDVIIQEKHTKVILYAHMDFSEMDKNDRIRACYQHACLKYVKTEKMTNQSLRERFKLTEDSASIVTRIIKDTMAAGLIKEDNPENSSKKYAKYIPAWS